MKRMNGRRKSGIMRVAWACGALWCGGAAAALETAGDLLIDLDAARVADVADGAARSRMRASSAGCSCPVRTRPVPSTTPTERGVMPLLDLRASAWTGPLAITVVDGAGAPVKGKAYLSGGVLKFDTTTGTALILR